MAHGDTGVKKISKLVLRYYFITDLMFYEFQYTQSTLDLLILFNNEEKITF